MARIPVPEYQQQRAPRGDLPIARASMATADDPTGRVLEQAGRGLEQIALRQQAAVERTQEEDGKAYAGTALSNARLYWDTEFQRRADTAQPGAPDFTGTMVKDYQAWAAEQESSAPTPAAKRFLQAHLRAYGDSLQGRALNYEADQRLAFRTTSYEGAALNWSKVVNQDNSQYSVGKSALTETLPDVGPANRQKLLDSALKQLRNAAAQKDLAERSDLAFDALERALPTAAPGAPPVAQYPERGLRNNNPGNIIKSGISWPGKTVGEDPRFETFDSPEAGIAALGSNLLAYQRRYGLNTVQGIISRWAPSSENNTAAYVGQVSKALGVKPDQAINVADPATLRKLTESIIQVENGKQPYSDGQLRTGVDSALSGQPVMVASAGPVAVSMPVSDVPQERVSTGVPWIDDMTVPELVAYRREAATAEKRKMAEAQAALRKTGTDLEAMALAGQAPPQAMIPSRNQYRQAYGQLEGDERYDNEVAGMIALGDSIRSMATMSPTERAAELARSVPRPGPGFDQQQRVYQARVKAAAAVEKALDDDPAAYVGRSATTIQAARQSMTDAMGSGDPARQRQAASRYAELQIAEQSRLGVAEPKILTTPEAEAIVQTFLDQREGGNTAADLVSGLEQQWGAYWPQVYGQLAKTGKMPPAALVIPNIRDAGARERAARWSQPEAMKGIKLRVPAAEQTETRDSLRDELEPFYRSLAVQNGGEATYRDVVGVAETLALGYVAQGKNPRDAARQAAAEAANSNYEFGPTYRVPASEMPREVMTGTERILRGVDNLPLQVPESLAGLTPANARAAYLDTVRNYGVFVTNGDETGLMLYVDGNNGLNPVRGQDGQILSFTWKQLRDTAMSDLGTLAPAITQGGAFIGLPGVGRNRGRAAGGE